MKYSEIDSRLKQLFEKKKSIINNRKAEYQIDYNSTEWLPENERVLLKQDHIRVNEGQGHIYISYLEKNNSFNIAPSQEIIKDQIFYEKLRVQFEADMDETIKIQLFILLYNNEHSNQIHVVEVNSETNLTLENSNRIRLALRIEGYGNIEIKRICLTPNMESIGFNMRHKKKGELNQEPVRYATDVKVAILADEFTFESFKYECDAVYISPHNWLEIFQNENPELFFCESAWSGRDSDAREWRGKVYSSINFKNENRIELLSIIKYCRENGIPTVFWNKEDPSHYSDKVHNFVETALHFDYIFTTAEECVPMYKEEYKHKNVDCLMFAVQPRQFNPIETMDRTDEVVFAGSYYRQHNDRCIEMERIFNNIINDAQLVIYDRQYYNDDKNHEFPERFTPYIRPRLPYTQLDKAYKGSRYALNINTVIDSNTMFARRVFELMASNTIVLSNYSTGVSKQFGDLVYLMQEENDSDVLATMLNSNYEKQRLLALRFVLSNHTYEHRMAEIYRVAGIPVRAKERNVGMLVCVEDEKQVQIALRLFEKQTYFKKRLFIINTNPGTSLNTAKWISKYANNQIHITELQFYEKYEKKIDNFFDCSYIAFVNLSYYYGNQYLLDMMNTYKYLNQKDIVVKNFDHSPYTFVAEASLYAAVIPSELLTLQMIKATNKNDVLKKLFRTGTRLFNIDRFNLINRSSDNPKEKMIINV